MFLGIDTSCYTTSLAVVDNQGRLLADERRLLAVAGGERGLRQSEGLFMHVQNLPQLAAGVHRAVGNCRFDGIAASVRPRPVAGSYMPVFTAGTSFGRSLAALLQIPCLELSHQEGHLLAGSWSAGVDWQDFYALHVSGGTTELLDVTGKAGTDGKFLIRELGGSADLHAGQFIDRAGVALGLPFPSGPHLEQLAQQAEHAADIPVAVRGMMLSFSGPESHVRRLIAAGHTPPAQIARGIERAVAEALWRIIRNLFKAERPKPVLFVGGVMANLYIRSYLSERLSGECAFAGIKYAGDNAVGAALFARNTLTERDNFA